MKKLLLLLAGAGLLVQVASAQSTGKITGTVTDSKTTEPVIGANVVIQGTHYGAAADLDGKYSIYNIPPGEYSLIVSSVGYTRVIISKVVVKINLTTRQDIKMNSEDILSEEVLVEAEAPLVQKDLTSSSVTVTSSDIKAMPVENVSQVINLQAGVVDGHFRGGRSNEVSYLVDGVPVNDSYNNSLAVGVENASVRQLEVISGTFNAEYGNAMSGVVNIISQEGSTSKYDFGIQSYIGNHYSSDKKIFRHLQDPLRIDSKDIQASFSGPIPFFNSLTFFTTARYLNEDGYLYGQRIYKITDRAPLVFGRDTLFFNTGDKAWVAMAPYQKFSFNGRTTWTSPLFKVSYSIFYDDNLSQGYSHDWSQAPDGRMKNYRTNIVQTAQFTHIPTSNTFHVLSFGYNKHQYEGYTYKDPYDPRYIDPALGAALSNYTFRSGGNEGGRYDRYTNSFLVKWQLTSQLNDKHKLGVGAEARWHELFNHDWNLRNSNTTQKDSLTGELIFVPGYFEPHTAGNQSYLKKPFEFSGYIQDKMEYDMMIINAGVRVDYFDPNTTLPKDLKNPLQNTLFTGTTGFKKTTPKIQASPRLGVSFPISDKGAIHFSYGHFFQIPPLENLYVNDEYLVAGGQALSSVTGNGDLKPQKTVSYEFGLQQVLFDNLSIDGTLYYRDIRNLLGMEIINTYEGYKYARFINRDYGNVRGVVLSLAQVVNSYLNVKLDYTYQIAEGNSSDPYQVYNYAQSDPPQEAEKKVVPLDWDQRSTLNIFVQLGNFEYGTLSAIFSYGSGYPYTEDVRNSQGLRFSNGGTKPDTYSFDLRAEKGFTISGVRINTFLLVYNVLNIKNEYGVFGSTGRANRDIYTKFATPIIGLNTLGDYINDPTRYSAPRNLKLGLSFSL